MTRLTIVLLALLLAGCSVGGPGGAVKPAFSPMAFPCLSYTLPCGKVAVRAPQQQTLDGPAGGDAKKGKVLAFARKKGNCLACHVMKGGTQPGSRGPDLSAYGTWGRSDSETYALVYDMRSRTPDTVMPPFGTNEILTPPQIRDVVAFLQSSR